MDEQAKFQNACYKGNLKEAEQIFKIYPNFCIAVCNELNFTIICSAGHLQVAKWLLQVNPTINISVLNESPFWWSCYRGNLEVAEWLQTLKPFKYSIKIKNNKIINKINPDCTENLLFILYTLKYQKYTNNLTPNIVTYTSKYI